MAQNVEYIISLRDRFSRQLKNANRTIDKTTQKTNMLTNAFRNLAPAMGLAGVGLALRDAIGVAIQFEKEMANVRALTEANDKQFKELAATAEQLGKTTAFTAKEAAEGMGFLAMAGFSVQETLDAIPGALELAAAGSLDLASAADIASNVLTQFGLEAKEIGRINDILAKTATSTNTNVLSLGESMKFAGTTAGILKQSVEETSAALGLLANAGLRGSIGGTSLNMALMELGDTSSQQHRALKAMGVQIFDVEGKFLGLTKIVQQMEEQGISSTKALELFGTRSGRAMGVLLEQGGSKLAQFTQEMFNAEGTARRIAEIKLDTLQGDVVKLKSAYQGLSITIQKQFNNAMRASVKRITGLVQWLERNADTIATLIKLTIKVIKLYVAYKTSTFLLARAHRVLRIAMIAYNRGMKSAIALTRTFNTVTKTNIVGLAVSAFALLASEIWNVVAARKADAEAIRDENKAILEGSLLDVRKKGEDVLKQLGVVEREGFNIAFNPKGLKELQKNLSAFSIEEIQGMSEVLSTHIKEFDRQKKETGFAPVILGLGTDISKLREIKKTMDEITSKHGGTLFTGGVGLDTDSQKQLSRIEGAAPKVFNINIDGLIKAEGGSSAIQIVTETVEQGVTQIKERVTEVLTEALQDVQLQTR